MIATSNGETQEIERRRHGVLWCPFCDHSAHDTAEQCAKCGAVFGEEQAAFVSVYEVPEAIVDAIPITAKFIKETCLIEDCGQMVSTMPAAQATHRKKHERDRA